MSKHKSKQLKEKLLPNASAKADAKPELTEHEIEEMKRKVPLLQRIDEVQSSKDFLEESTYFIELKRKCRTLTAPIELYEVHSTCSFHENMTYSPVLLKINHATIKNNLRANYILQVWKQGGRKVYERLLQGKPPPP